MLLCKCVILERVFLELASEERNCRNKISILERAIIETNLSGKKCLSTKIVHSAEVTVNNVTPVNQ